MDLITSHSSPPWHETTSWLTMSPWATHTSRKDTLRIMKAPVETLRIGKQGRDQLIKIRRNTGIENWNIICRWAFCVSLKEPTPPPIPRERLDGGVEMTWKVFAGEESDLYASLLILRAQKDGMSCTPDGLAKCLRAHVNRGLSYLSSGTETRCVTDFIERWAY